MEEVRGGMGLGELGERRISDEAILEEPAFDRKLGNMPVLVYMCSLKQSITGSARVKAANGHVQPCQYFHVATVHCRRI